jgi:GT2 family glycosyltransferase
MLKQAARVPIIIVNYGRADIFKQSLTSLFQSDFLDHELHPRVIVIDNEPSDATRDAMFFFKYRINDMVFLLENKGKPHAWNLGISMVYQLCVANGEQLPDYFVFCDSDIVYFKDWFHKMVGTCEAFSDLPIGILGGFMNDVGEHKIRRKRKKGYQIQVRRYIPGCCWIIPRFALEKIGMFDSAIKIRGVDTTYCQRAWRMGFTNGVVSPQTVVKHIGEGLRTWDLVQGYSIRMP